MAAIALGVVVAVAALAEWRGWPMLRSPVENTLTRMAGVPVGFGGAEDRFALRLLGRPRLVVSNLLVGAAPGPPAPHLLSGQDVTVAWRWPDAWRWWRGSAPPRLTRLDARTLDLNLLRDAEGRATWQIGPADRRDAQRDDLPHVGLVTVGAGRIVLVDMALDTDLLIHLEGAERIGNESRPSSGWRARAEGRWKTTPMQLAISAGGAMPLVADSASGASSEVDLHVEGRFGAARLLFDGRAGALLGARRLEGQGRIAGPSLALVGDALGLTLPQTPPFDMEGQLHHEDGLWQLRAERADIGRSRLAGEFRYDTRPAKPELTGRLVGPRLALADLGPAIGGSADDAAGPAADGRVLPRRRFDLPSLSAMNADVHVAIDQLDLGTEALAPLRDVATRVLLVDGRLELQQLQATVAGGTVRGASSYDGSGDVAQWAAQLRLANIDMAGWLRAAQTAEAADSPTATESARLERQRRQARQGGEQPVRHWLTGALDGHFDLRGQGESTGAILATLDGRIGLRLSEGTLSHLATEVAGLDLAESLGVMLRGDRPLPLHCARIEATARSGIVRTDLAVLDNEDSTIRVAGELNLQDESLALVARTRPKDFSPLSLRTPIRVRGTLADPVVSIDGGGLAGRLGAAALLGLAVGPFAALLPLVDFGSVEDKDPCAARPAPAGR
jgi:AsmA family protein